MDPIVFDDETRDLLIRNSTYLDAIQNASVTVYSLGFENLQYRTGRVLSNRDRSLKAIVPKDEQVSFLERVDRTMKQHFARSRKRRNMLRYSLSVKEPLTMEELKAFQQVQRAKTPKINPKNGLPVARPLRRIVEMAVQAKKDEEAKKQNAKHQKRMSEQYDILRNGEKHVYGPNGNLIPAIQYEHILEERVKQEKLAKTQKQHAEAHLLQQSSSANKLKSSGPVNVELWNKTVKHVEKLRSITTIRKEYPSWTPGKYPDSTLPLSYEQEALPPQVVRPWPEVTLLQPGDLLITIEHCAGCAYHEEFTQHHEEQYLDMARKVVESLKETAGRYAVRYFAVLKPIQSSSIDNATSSAPVLEFQKGSEENVNHASANQTKVITVSHLDLHLRIGAFEVQVALCVDKDSHHKLHNNHGSSQQDSGSHDSTCNKDDCNDHNKEDGVQQEREVIQHLLFSKLCRGAWPSIDRLRERLEALLDIHNVPRLVPGSTVHRKPRSAKSRLLLPKNNSRLGGGDKKKEEVNVQQVLLPPAVFDHRFGLVTHSNAHSDVHSVSQTPVQHHESEQQALQKHELHPPAQLTSSLMAESHNQDDKVDDREEREQHRVKFAASIPSPKVRVALPVSHFNDYQFAPQTNQSLTTDDKNEHDHHRHITEEQIAALPHNTTDRVLEEVKLGLTPRQILHELLETAVDENEEGLLDDSPSLYEISYSDRANSSNNLLVAKNKKDNKEEQRNEDGDEDDDNDDEEDHGKLERKPSLHRKHSVDLIHATRSTVRQTLLSLQQEMANDDTGDLDEPSTTAEVDDFWKRPELTGGDLSTSMLKSINKEM